MQYRKLQSLDVNVSTIAMGCWAIAGGATWGDQDEADSISAIDASLDAGINFFDTAEAYGNGYSEELLGKTLASRRSDVVVATKPKSSRMSREEIIRSCEGSLHRLQTDYIDLYQLHWPNRDVPLDETMEAVYTLQKQGKIRAVGVCNFGPQDLHELLQIGPVVSNQVAYNLIFRGLEFDLQEQCQQEEIGILCYSPLAQGLLTGKYRTANDVPDGRARTRHFSSARPQARHGEDGFEKETFTTIDTIRTIVRETNEPMGNVALAWLLQQPAVTSVLTSGRNAEQVAENVQAADLQLPGYIIDQLTEATDSLKQAMGPNMDMWSAESRMR